MLTYLALSLSVVFIVTLGFAVFRTYSKDIPLISSCSAAISAACHLPKGDKDAYLFSVQWGETPVENGGGHIAFTTSRNVKPPILGKYYA